MLLWWWRRTINGVQCFEDVKILKFERKKTHAYACMQSFEVIEIEAVFEAY